MLKEITNVKQIKNEHCRRWFNDPVLDLFVWYDGNENIIKFQLCYDKGVNEHALTWSQASGFTHHGVDDGEGGIYEMKSSPMLVPDGILDTGKIADLFTELGQKIDHDIFDFVITRIRDYQ